MKGPDKLRRDDRRRKIADMRLRGLTQDEIAAELGVTQGAISRTLKRMSKEWQESASRNIAELKAQQLAEIASVKAEAWNAWSESRSTKTKRVAGKRGDEVSSSITTEDQFGDPAYLSAVLKAITEESKILGTHAPVKHAATDTTGSEDRTLTIWAAPPELSLDEWQKHASTLTRQ